MASRKARSVVRKAVRKATRPKSRVRAKSKASAKRTPAGKVAVSPRTPKPAPLSERKFPETLRLKSFTPGFTVNDLAKSIAFYTEGLGFIVGQRWTEGEVLRGVMLKAGATELGLSQDDWKLGRDRKKGEGFRLWCETTQDLDAIAARLKAAGFPLTSEPTDNPEWKMRSFSVDDPDGYHLTISRDL